MFIGLSVCVYTESMSPRSEKVVRSLELGIQIVPDHLMWVLGAQ